MASEHQTLRLQPALLARAEALVPLLADDTRLAGLGTVTRSTVLRVALARGLDALEAEYGAAPRRKPPGTTRRPVPAGLRRKLRG